jgi:hypothetical protein
VTATTFLAALRQANRERFDKEMENPQARFVREAAKAAAVRAGRETPKEEPSEAIREFNKQRAEEREPPRPLDGS